MTPATTLPVPPDWSAMAISMAAQNNAIATQSLWLTGFGVAIGVGALFAGVVWGHQIRKEARDVAEKEARKAALEWMDDKLLDLVADRLADLEGRMVRGEQERQARDMQETGDE